MMVTYWLLGLMKRRTAGLLGAALSIAATFAFIATLGSFIVSSTNRLTVRAAAQVPVDWQVQVTAQGDPAAVRAELLTTTNVRALEKVRFAQVPGLRSRSSTGTRSTGRATLVALPTGYNQFAPPELRYLLGAHQGVLLLQQTAANLGAGAHSSIEVASTGGRTSVLKVDGVVDLPFADSFFQVVGAPAGAGATAPPDNVVLLPGDLFDALTAGRPVVTQFHVQFKHDALPSDPAAAAALLTQRVNNYQTRITGGALVGDNLGAALSAARQDAIYARLLILLLGLPGLALAGIVAASVNALRGDRRRRDAALLRVRGAPPGTLMALAGAETAATLVLGIAVGIPLTFLCLDVVLPVGTALNGGWAIAAVAASLLLAAVTQIGPVLRPALRPGVETVNEATSRATPKGSPWPLRYGLDALLLAGAGISFFLTARGGYQVVVVPEGVPVASVNYAALIAPALAWPGLALLVWRLALLVLSRRTGHFGWRRPGRAPELVAASIRRRRSAIARGSAGLAVAVALATSTAIFTLTYDQQARLDVALTVGADVAVTMPAGSGTHAAEGDGLATARAVKAVEPLQHRLAYVGADLQDLYGIHPQTIGRAAPLLDSFVPGSTIRQALSALASTPNGVLLSAETIHDYQLRPGDPIRLRLQAGAARQYRTTQFRVVGVIKEFPTAPKDSFLVANADYISRVTADSTVDTFLLKSSDPLATRASLRHLIPAGAKIHDVVTDRASVPSASGLANADLSGLNRLEAVFGLAFALCCSGLALALGISERRRALVILAALGATRPQRQRFLAAEARALLAGGVAGGLAVGSTIAYILVKVLNGIFDPAPDRMAVPFVYLFILVGAVLLASWAVVSIVGRVVGRSLAQLRDM